MTYGASFYNQSGFIQFNSTEFNFVMSGKGTLSGWVPDTSWGDGSGSHTYKTYLYVLGYAPIIALNSAMPVSVQSATFDGTYWIFYIVAPLDVVSYTVEWFAFDIAAAVPATADEYGFALYNSAGQNTFRLGHKPLRGIEFLALPRPPTTAGSDYVATQYRTVPAGKKYAILQCGLFLMSETLYWAFTGEFGFADYRNSELIQSAKIVGSTATFEIRFVYSHIEEMPDWVPSARSMSGCIQWMLIDVTDY